MDFVDKSVSEEDERKLKNLATRIMSNGVEVLVKDKNSDAGKLEQRKTKVMHLSPRHQNVSPKQSLLSSAVATVLNHQQISAMLPLNQLMQHNYIIKTCLTTFTYLTTVVQNKRSAISTFETIVSVVTTESLTNVYATDFMPDIKPTRTKIMEVKTIHPSAANKIYQSNLPKIDKRIDNDSGDRDQSNFDVIQPSEVGHAPCTSSCSCSHTKTEGLNTKYNSDINSLKKVPLKSSKHGATKLDVKPTSIDKKTQFGPYEFESSSQSAPIDKVVEKYTEVINDYSDEKDSGSVEQSELLTNEQAPSPPKTNKITNNKTDKMKPEKPQKPNKNKFVVADLLKLGSLGIKGLSQLAPVIEKMTGGFMKRQDDNQNKSTTTTTIKPETKLTPYTVNKRIDSELDKHNNFPIYIPVDDMETSESQLVFSNATLHQNLVWAAEHKHPKAHIVPTKIVHESPLLNGGIPISPGEIITANSDVIVGKPAVGGPLTLAASGIRLQNPVNPPSLDSFVAANEHYVVQDKPLSESSVKVDDSYDLRPPDLPKPIPVRNMQRLPMSKHHELNYHGSYTYQNQPNKISPRPHLTSHQSEQLMQTEQIKTNILGNHGRPAFLDYIPSFAPPDANVQSTQQNNNYKLVTESKEEPEFPDNSPSSSEIVNTRVKTNGEYISSQHLSEPSNKPFLVDIQPSRVANVLIPHGSSTALVFAGSSEPHKTGDYVDDPLPYPEPGYFGSFSIDAPQMTNVHNVPPSNNNKPKPTAPIEPHASPSKESGVYRYDQNWKENKRPIDYTKLPPPTSNQETHFHVGPHITVYNPDIYKPVSNGKFEKYNSKYNKDGKEVIDKEYENFLAVPPPPPRKMQSNHENNHFNQKPIVHTKPIQDMKVFLNIQHPVPKPHKVNQDKSPPKVTSEVYYAAQAPQNTQTPTYTIQIPNLQNQGQNNHYNHVNSKIPINNIQNQFQVHHRHPEQNSFTVVSSPNIASKPGLVSDANDKDNTYTVTLNTATNVANNNGEAGQIVGSSVPVSVGVSNNINTDIPIGSNFAITVEDGPSPFDNYNTPIQGNQSPPFIYDQNSQVDEDVSIEDNRWNSTSLKDDVQVETSTNTINHHSSTHKYSEVKPFHKETETSTAISSVNSHANFPMVNDVSTPSNKNIKPVTEYVDDIKLEQKRPAKLIPNIPTNSHGWYSSIPINDYNNNRVKEVTTRKAIPLLFEYHRDSTPDYGQKISSAGKPPTEFWTQNKHVLTDIGKPFTKPVVNEKPLVQSQQFTTKPLDSHYHNLGAIRQPVYDIPVRDNSDETTTPYIKPVEIKKPVYEDSHEVYDGEEDNSFDSDSEVSLESMHEPVISISEEKDNKQEETKSSTELTLLQDEGIPASKDEHNNKQDQLIEFNPGTQTEKPFDAESYNKSNNFQSNSIKPIEDNPYTKPRPFTINTATTLDHQLQQPHWQINQLMENATNMSYEENLELNIGEEMSTVSTSKPKSTQKVTYHHQELNSKYKRPQRPVFSLRPSNSNQSNIITSTVHLKDKKPLTILGETEDKSSTLPSFTIPATDFDLNRSSSEIIDLSPPPPTMDYNFKPSNKEEEIMGMSPPPPAHSVNPPIRQPIPTRSPVTPRPIRTPPPYRNKPSRTTSPRIPTQRPTRKPISRDEVSTYRPSYDILNNIKRPSYNRDQPSSQLLPPPREIPTRIIPINDIPSPTIKPASVPNLVFPTPISSGWLTSSGVGFSSAFDFGPTAVKHPTQSSSSYIPEMHELPTTDKSLSYEVDASSSTERLDNVSSEDPVIANRDSIPSDNNGSTTAKIQTLSEETKVSDSVPSETSHEDTSTDKMKVIPLRNKNRTRKPYPGREEDKKPNINKFQVPNKPSTVISPSRPFSRPDNLYPIRQNTNKYVRPALVNKPATVRPVVIESSESLFDENIIQPTVVLKDDVPTLLQPEKSIITERTPPLESSIVYSEIESVIPLVKPTHHAGNEVKIVDEIIPTKTEFRTTVVTLTKTLSEPPKTVSSIGYVNLTHTLTVTHIKTSLVSQSEGAKTQTLIITNTETSTIVDVVTEIRTQVQPTTIIETVTKHVPIPQIEPTPVKELPAKTKIALDDVTMSSEEKDNFIIRDSETTENIQKIQENEGDNESFFVVMNKSQNGGQSPSVSNEVDTGDYDVTRNEQVNNNGVSQVLFGEILLAGTPYLETTNVVNPTGIGYAKECQPDCKASRNERCQRIDGLMKCVCRPGFARMFPDRPCKPTYTYSVKLALSSQGTERLQYHDSLADNSSSQYHSLALATHEGINRMVMQSDLRDVYHGVHITGFHPVEMTRDGGEDYQGVMNDFYVQLSDNAHENRLKEVIEKYLRNNNYSLGGTEVFAASELIERLNVSDFDECLSGQFHDCSEHAQCFNLRGTYTCSCLEGFADLSVNPLYPGRVCSAEPVGCEKCNYHGACYSRDDSRVLCECFQWYAGSSCHINLKVVLISLVTVGALLTVVLVICAVIACSKRPQSPPQRSIVACIQGMPGLHQGAQPGKQRADRRALINERADSGDASSVQNASLPYMPAKKQSSSGMKKMVISEPPAHEAPPPPAPAVMIPRARLHPPHRDSREMASRKQSLELSSEAKLISYLESGANANNDEMMRRKHSMESSYSAPKDRHHNNNNKQGALVSAGFKVSTTIRPDDPNMRDDRDDMSSINKNDLEAELARFDSLRQSYSHEDLSEWTDAERRIGELTLSEARSVGGTLPASTGRAASSARLTNQEANTMAERDLGSTFLLPHVHLYKPDITSDVSEFDSL